MRTLVSLGFLAAAIIAVPGQGRAAVAAPELGATPSAGILLVEGGCGPGFFRAQNGYCYRMRPPPPRACPPGMHLDRFYHCIPNY